MLSNRNNFLIQRLSGSFYPALFNVRACQWRRIQSRIAKTKSPQRPVKCRRARLNWNVFPWDEYVSRLLYTYGEWQFREIDLVLNWLQTKSEPRTDASWIVNIGAFIGTTALRIASRSKFDVFSIEPNPESFELLQQNVKQNRFFHRIHTTCCAVYDRHADLVLSVPEGNGGGAEIHHSTAESMVHVELPIRKQFSVTGAPLESILSAEQIVPDRVALVWADTQGCEGHILRTGSELWKKGVPLVTEFWPRGHMFQDQASIIPLIRQYFRSFCVLPGAWWMPQELHEQPIDSLEPNIVGSAEEVDLLLIP